MYLSNTTICTTLFYILGVIHYRLVVHNSSGAIYVARMDLFPHWHTFCSRCNYCISKKISIVGSCVLLIITLSITFRFNPASALATSPEFQQPCHGQQSRFVIILEGRNNIPYLFDGRPTKVDTSRKKIFQNNCKNLAHRYKDVSAQS